MEADDEDLSTGYLLFAVAAIIVIEVTAAEAFIIFIGNVGFFRRTQIRAALLLQTMLAEGQLC